MKSIPLTRGKVAVVDDGDYERLAQLRWQAARDGNTWYAVHSVYTPAGVQKVRMHRAIVGADPSVEIDHVDGDGLNNQRQNLRAASHAQNAQNCRRPRTNTSGYKGVTFHRQCARWQAAIRVGGRSRHLGLFATPAAAHAAYVAAAERLFGEFARAS